MPCLRVHLAPQLQCISEVTRTALAGHAHGADKARARSGTTEAQMQDMEYISSAGLRIFLGILQNAEEKGGHVYIKGLNDTVQAIFDLTGFSNIFEFM